MAQKEGDFGGLPEDLFNQISLFLNQQIAAAGATSGPAALALAALANEEHSGSNPQVELRVMDTVFKLLGLHAAFIKVQNAGNVATELGNFTTALNTLSNYWATGH
jgi:hypothetical protein